MIKDELMLNVYKEDSNYIVDISIFNEFFESNVCVPRSDMEHLVWMYRRLVDRHNENPNYDYMLKYASIIGMKPSGPIFEWQWTEDGVVRNLNFYTEDEIDFKGPTIIERIQTTKRERK